MWSGGEEWWVCIGLSRRAGAGKKAKEYGWLVDYDPAPSSVRHIPPDMTIAIIIAAKARHAHIGCIPS